MPILPRYVIKSYKTTIPRFKVKTKFNFKKVHFFPSKDLSLMLFLRNSLIKFKTFQTPFWCSCFAEGPTHVFSLPGGNPGLKTAGYLPRVAASLLYSLLLFCDQFKVFFIEFVTILLLFYILVLNHKACGILTSRPGIKPTPLHWNVKA